MSSVENLNKIFLEFCDDLSNVIPEYKEAINNAKKRIEENPSTKYYLEYFFRHCIPYSLDITSTNPENLKEMNLVHGVKFKHVWDKEISFASKHALWRYLHTFYFLVQSYPKLDRVIEKYADNEISFASKHALWRYLHTFYFLVQSYPKLDRVIEKYADNENIGKIKFALEQHDTNVQNIMKASERFAADALRETGSIPNLGKCFEGMDEKKFEEKFLNSSIGNLAKEISEDLDVNDLKCMENPDDLLKTLVGGGGDGKGLGNIIHKISDKLQTKLSNGQLSEDALMKEATQMMGMLNPALQSMGGKGGMGDLFSMMGGLMGAGGGKKKGKKK